MPYDYSMGYLYKADEHDLKVNFVNKGKSTVTLNYLNYPGNGQLNTDRLVLEHKLNMPYYMSSLEFLLKCGISQFELDCTFETL